MDGKMENGDKRVLIVSDRPNFGNMLNFLFISQGFKTDLHRNLQGSVVSAVIDSEPADLLIYDKPLLHNGNSNICRTIGESKSFKHIPQIVLSSSKEECIDCSRFDSGRCSNVQKPFVSAELLSKVREFTAWLPTTGKSAGETISVE
ncbi:MAG: hypothetical protein RQ824_03665 [bacterium]|nr:hypothetical protein [bacterium]